MLKENKLSKYLLYAIGEIILVVIGILIALSINNWNISRQDAIFEKNILFELKASIENDLKGFRDSEERVIKKDHAIDTLLMFRNNIIELSDKQLRQSHLNVGLGNYLSYDRAAFETLKNSGLQKITADTLKKEITRFYEVQLPKFQQFIDENYYNYKPERDEADDKLRLINFYEDYFEPSEDSTEYFIRVKYDFDKIYTEEYKAYLLINAKYKRADWGRIRTVIEYTEALLAVINKEIETRYTDE
jgi:hypothetical protein